MKKWSKTKTLISTVLPIILLQFNNVQAATPGIPFTEDFSDMALDASAITTANWDTAVGQLSLPEDTSFTPVVPASDTPANASVINHPNFATLVADFSGDGSPNDVVYGGDDGLWINDVPIAGVANVRDLATVDMDQDGDLDLIIAVRNGNNLSLRNNTIGGNPGVTYISPFFYNSGLVNNQSITPISLSANSDDTRAVVVADINRDGQPDYVFGNAGATVNVWVDGDSGVVHNLTADAFDTRDISVADIDNDGDMDVIAGNSNDLNKVYLNDGNGGFAGVGLAIGGSTFATRSIATADINGDGLIDVAVGTSSGMGYFLNGGTATLFSSAIGKQIGSSTAVVTDLIVRDINGDGRIDVLAARRNTNNAFFLNNGKANPFNGSTAEHVLSADSEDTRALDSAIDGSLKVYSANYNQLNRIEGLQPVSNSGERTKVQNISALTQPGKAVASGDVDNDGDIDFVVGNAAGTSNELFLNDSSGGFTRQALSDDGDTRAVLLADVNHDGRLDLISGNHGAVNRLYINNTFGALFASGQNLTADVHNTASLATGDFNGDGRLDIIAGNLGEKNRIYLNGLPAGTFSSGSDIETSISTADTRGIAVADIDQDGDMDILFANSNSTNHWAQNDGSGSFTTSDYSSDNQASYAVAVISAPGSMDPPAIVVGNNGSANHYYSDLTHAQSGGGIDVGAATGNTRAISVTDLDGNGVSDVVFGNAGQSNNAYLNSNWASAVVIGGNRATRALAAADITGDGLLDLIEVNSNAVDKLYSFDHPPLYKLNQNIAQSLEVDNSAATINEVILTVNESQPAGTSIDYYLTSNGGTDWYPAIPGQNTAFLNAGSDLRWRAELQSNSNLKTPVLTQLDIRATRTLTVNATTGGTITSNPAGIDCGATCEGRFAHNDNVTLSVALDPQYTVSSWTGAASCGTSTSCIVLMDVNKTITPVIEGVNVLSVSKSGNGRVTTVDGFIDCGVDCTHGYALSPTSSSVITELSATADAGWFFSSWGGSCTGQLNTTCTLNMNGSQSARANFILSQKTLTVMPNSNINVTSVPGSINCRLVGDVCSTMQDYGTSVTLTANAQPGQNFVAWGGDCAFAGVGSTCTLSLDSDKTVSTESTAQPRTLTVNNTGGGRIYSWSPGAQDEFINCGADCSEPFGQNTTVGLRAEAQAGWAFSGWDGAGCDSTSGPLNDLNCNLTMTTDRTITTSFVQVFNLTVNQSGPGLISSVPAGINCDGNFNVDCSENYVINTAVTLTAAPGVNGKFDGWSGGGCSGLASTCSVTMDQARTVSASFSYQYPLTVEVFGQGNVSSTFQPGINCPDNTCSADVPNGTVVTLNATPSADYDFSGWSGSGCSGTSSCVITVDGAKNVSASFSLKQYGLTAVVAGSGAANSYIDSSPPGINCLNDCFQHYDLNSVITLTATAAGTAYLSAWQNCPSANGNVCTVTMDQARTVTANFVRHYELTVNNAGGGSVSSIPGGIQCPLDCDEFYDSGSSVTLTATPASADYLFDDWSGACTIISGDCVVDMTQTRNVTASFSLKLFTLDLSLSGTGVSGSGVTSNPAGINTIGGDFTQDYDIHTLVTLTANASATAYFSGWTGGGCDAVTANTCTVSMDQAHSVTADFSRHWQLTVNNAGGGSVTSNPGGIDCPATACNKFFDDGSSVTLSATPASADYLFSGWSGACTNLSGTCVVSMTQARTVTATFSIKQFDLSVSKTGSGATNSTISTDIAGINCGIDCLQTYDINTAVVLTATPAANAIFSSWTGCPTENSNTCNLTMDAAHTVSAAFTRQQSLTVTLSGNGGGTVSSVPAGSINCGTAAGVDCSETVNQGTTITLSASTDSFSTFTGWFSDNAGTTMLAGCSSANANCAITLSSDVQIYPRFIMRQQTLDVLQFGKGSVASTPSGISTTWLATGSPTDSASYDADQSIALSANPVTGWRLGSWGGDCSIAGSIDVNGVGSCNVDMLTDRSVTATFLINQYNLMVNKTGSGSVSSDIGVIDCGSTCSDDYDYDSTVVLTAIPLDSSWLVTGWSGVSCINYDPLTPNSCTVKIIDSDQTAAVTFAQSYTLTVNSDGSGLGSISDGNSISCGANCTADFAPGSTVTLSATAQTNSVFSGWSLPTCPGMGDCNLTMNANQAVTATFDRLYTLTVSPGAGGSISANIGNINCGASCQDDYADGTPVTLTPLADSGQIFTGWSGDCSGNGACVVTMNQARSVSASFDLNGPTLSINILTGHGSVSSQPAGINCGLSCVKNFANNTPITLTATPDAGYLLADWGHPDCAGTGNCQLTMDAAKTLNTLFSPDSDGDGIIDTNDNCPGDANPDQADANSDGEGDVCDSNSDTDSDGVFDNADNCPVDANPGQEDNNGFDDVPGTAGDACEAVEDETICFPVKLSSGAVAVICL